MRYETTGAFHLEVLELAVGGGALWFLGKFADAYVSGIANRLAESTLKAAERIRLRRSPATDCVTIKVPGGTTTIVLPDPLTDQAREAFIDLDPAADEIRGKTLYWDQDTLAARRWRSRRRGAAGLVGVLPAQVRGCLHATTRRQRGTRASPGSPAASPRRSPEPAARPQGHVRAKLPVMSDRSRQSSCPCSTP
jgi:hypothetical protein